jgi:hypothetical protein
MKREMPPLEIELPPAKLYLEDLREMYQIAEQLLGGKDHRKVTANEEFEIESIDDFDTLAQSVGSTRIESLSINGYNPWFSFRCYKSVLPRITADADSTETVAAAIQIQKIWERRKRWGANSLKHMEPVLLALGGAAAVGFGLLQKDKFNFGLVFLTLMAVTLSVSIVVFIVRRTFKSVLLLTPRLESTTFYERNKDKIILAIAAAIGGVLLTKAVERFWH